MRTVAALLADPTIRAWYTAFCFGVMLLPISVLSYWYHSEIRKTEGGRKLMEEQARVGVRTPGGLQQVAGLAKAISAGAYGRDVRKQQSRTYRLVGIWLAANAVAFGILLWADEVNRSIE